MRRALLLAALLAAAGCRLDREPRQAEAGETPGVPRPADVRPTPPLPERFAGIGRPATAREVAAWDIDVNPTGAGLPPGRGTYARGAAVFAAQCAACHGPKGEGIGPYPRLIGAASRDSFPFARDWHIAHTVGNYWPYATTLYDYIHRAMPFPTPGSLSPDDTYSVIAWLLAENGVIARDAVMDARTLPRVRMPARDRFVRDDRKGGAEFR